MAPGTAIKDLEPFLKRFCEAYVE